MVQKGLFMFACTNSCMNPVVYGLFNIPRRPNKSDLVSISKIIFLDLHWISCENDEFPLKRWINFMKKMFLLFF